MNIKIFLNTLAIIATIFSLLTSVNAESTDGPLIINNTGKPNSSWTDRNRGLLIRRYQDNNESLSMSLDWGTAYFDLLSNDSRGRFDFRIKSTDDEGNGYENDKTLMRIEGNRFGGDIDIFGNFGVYYDKNESPLISVKNDKKLGEVFINTDLEISNGSLQHNFTQKHPALFRRVHRDDQVLAVSVKDKIAQFLYVNDESDGQIDFEIRNTDTENSDGRDKNFNILMSIVGNKSGGNVDVKCDLKVKRNIVSDGDICIGNCN